MQHTSQELKKGTQSAKDYVKQLSTNLYLISTFKSIGKGRLALVKGWKEEIISWRHWDICYFLLLF